MTEVTTLVWILVSSVASGLLGGCLGMSINQRLAEKNRQAEEKGPNEDGKIEYYV